MKSNPFYRHRKIILVVMGILSVVAFMIGPILQATTPYPVHVLFLQAVIFTNVEVIPFFAYMGLMLHFKLAKMQNRKYDALSRHILITVLICAALGLSAGAIALYLIIDPRYEWILIELVWIFDIIFSCFLFTVMARRAEKKLVETSSGSNQTDPSSKHSSKGSVNSLPTRQVSSIVDSIAVLSSVSQEESF
jgi:hypothetical protein